DIRECSAPSRRSPYENNVPRETSAFYVQFLFHVEQVEQSAADVSRGTNKRRGETVPRETRGQGEREKILSKYLFHVKQSPKNRKIFSNPPENPCKNEKFVLYYG
ncbi:MAG: hypothetical protein IKM33_03870, partial [Clostridia bacterium]|nr:hypothetical protein [Clostridia bacterium]